MVDYIRTENLTYPACPRDYNGRTCNKKLQDNAGGGGAW